MNERDEIDRHDEAREPKRDDALPSARPEGGGDLTRAVSEMKRLLGEIDQIEKAGSSGGHGALQVTARILQYVHDSHLRIVKTLENQDRSELFLQSTTALNQTFRRLNQSQDALVEKLLAERRKSPLWIALGAGLTGVLVVVAVFLLFDYRQGGLGREVDRMASARDELTGAIADSQRNFQEMGTQLATTVDKVLTANRVLDNENRARSAELERVRAELDAAKRTRDDAEKGRADQEAKLADLEREKRTLVSEVDSLRTKFVDREMVRDPAALALDPRVPEGATPAPASPKPESPATESADVAPSAPATTAPDAPISPVGDGAAPAAPEPIPPEPDLVEPVPVPLVDPTTQAFNEFLAAAGVFDHRLLRHSGVKEGALCNVVLELRSAEGLPIGFRSAETLEISVDPGVMSAKLLLQGGESVERNARTPFPEDGFVLEIPAVAKESLTVSELLPFLELSAPAPEKPADPPASRFDAAVPLALLNGRLASEGRSDLRFSQIEGIDAGRLTGVALARYSGAGALVTTVHARSCAIEVDPADRRASLVFRDGRHVSDGREVPFFAGKAAAGTTPTWRLDLDDADCEEWLGLKERLASERFIH